VEEIRGKDWNIRAVSVLFWMLPPDGAEVRSLIIPTFAVFFLPGPRERGF